MTFLTWTADLDTGIAKVDDEHRQIVDCINVLHAVSKSGRPKSDQLKAIEQLATVAVKHFRDEEAIMQQAKYEYFDLHKGVHDRFLAKLQDLKGRFESGVDTAEPILEMMDNWLYSHIKNNDRGYVNTVRSVH